MSDIRSFFNKKPTSSNSKQSKASNSNKKKRLVISDSDDEAIEELPLAPPKKRKTNSPEVIKVKDSKKSVDASDFFGSSKVKKANTPLAKKTKVSTHSMKSDDELFDDSDFMGTLQETPSKPKTRPKENVTPPKVKSPGDSSLAGKLAAKKKGLGWKEKVGFPKRSHTEVSNTMVTTKTQKLNKISKVTIEAPSGLPKPIPEKQRTNKISKVSASPETSPKSSNEKEGSTKKGNSNYWAYRNREGPKNLGSKEIPKGKADCLKGLTFVITGVLDSLEKDDAVSLVQSCGGRVTSAVSRKTTYLLKGDHCGATKLAKAEELKIKIIEEDDLLDMIREKSGLPKPCETLAEDITKMEEEEQIIIEETPKEAKVSSSGKRPLSRTEKKDNQSQPWTEKYRPIRVKDIIGQQGEKSNVNKLLRWLKNWDKWNRQGMKAPFSKEEGCHLKAALLSGPPGVGKTTSATVCCKELNYTYLEMNASDVRSKKSLEMHISDLIGNHTIAGIVKKDVTRDKHVLIMDEVDGMAGNEDRGGMKELIQIIKASKIPIICICNDRNAMKIKSLANYCFDLRFYKPRLEQVRGAMMSIAFKEGIKISPQTMSRIIEGCNGDVRQTLNNLRMWSADNAVLDAEKTSVDAKRARKDMRIGVFDIPRLLFNADESSGFTYNDYNDVFFQDYGMAPFFIHENYVRPRSQHSDGDPLKSLKCVANAADSICMGDSVNAAISMQHWSLLPTQALYAAIMPSFYMRGSYNTMVQFPRILGQTSKKNKCDGNLQDLTCHMVLHVSADKRGLGMDYLPLLQHKLLTPMIRKESEGVDEVVATMGDYDLLREDWDNIMDLATFSDNPSQVDKLSSKTKAMFTRKYNKMSHLNPYAEEAPAIKRKRKRIATKNTVEYGDEMNNNSEVSDDEDVMIKPKNKSKSKPASASSSAKQKNSRNSRK